jgi:hypothetical protein
MPSATLSWAASPGPNLAGYKIHHGTSSGVHNNPLTGWPVDVGLVLTHTLTGLNFNEDYFLAVTAYNPQGFDSAESNEVVVNVPNIIPGAPSTLTVDSTSP